MSSFGWAAAGVARTSAASAPMTARRGTTRPEASAKQIADRAEVTTLMDPLQNDSESGALLAIHRKSAGSSFLVFFSISVLRPTTPLTADQQLVAGPLEDTHGGCSPGSAAKPGRPVTGAGGEAGSSRDSPRRSPESAPRRRRRHGHRSARYAFRPLDARPGGTLVRQARADVATAQYSARPRQAPTRRPSSLRKR